MGFPLLLRILKPSSPRLGKVLHMLETHLMSKHGIRSLDTSDPYYRKPNAPGDEAYWRGPIWMPINFLAASALHHYQSQPGPSQDLASRLYPRLRETLVENVFR